MKFLKIIIVKNSLLKQENHFLKNQIKELKKKNDNNEQKIFHESKGKNFIKAEYIISESEVNQDIRILNHDEQKEDYSYDSYGCNTRITGTDNQEEIEESCIIYFGNKQIDFSETFNFFKPGTYTFIFEFKYKLNNINPLLKYQISNHISNFINCLSEENSKLFNFLNGKTLQLIGNRDKDEWKEFLIGKNQNFVFKELK